MKRQKKKTFLQRLLRLIVKLFLLLIFLGVLLVLPWRWLAPPVTAFMLYDQYQNRIEVQYHWLPMEHISTDLAIAVVASEDQKFPLHHGFDLSSIVDAAFTEDRQRKRGASTISQQLAKNMFLWPGRSYLRKAIEAYFTVLIEIFWSKRRILEVYLNVVEFAPGIYGAAAASEQLFSKLPDKLTLHEAARLAAVLPNPKKMSAANPSQYVLKRSYQIQREIGNLGGVAYLPFLQR